jgi:hypothetical protein
MALSLTGCGIPSILYLSSSDYSFSALTQTTDTIGISTMSISSNDSKLDVCNGPNIVFFYSLSNNNDTDDSYYKNYPLSSFKSQYVVNTYQGLPVSSTNNADILSDGFSWTISGTTKKNNLYLFSEVNQSTQKFNADNYVIYRSSANIESLSNVTLSKAGTDSDISVKLSYTSDNYTTTDNVTNLYRYNGQPFMAKWKNGTNYTNNLDYSLCSSEADPVYLYIYAAFCISPISGSDFSNRVWSPLICLGYLQL